MLCVSKNQCYNIFVESVFLHVILNGETTVLNRKKSKGSDMAQEITVFKNNKYFKQRRNYTK